MVQLCQTSSIALRVADWGSEKASLPSPCNCEAYHLYDGAHAHTFVLGLTSYVDAIPLFTTAYKYHLYCSVASKSFLHR